MRSTDEGRNLEKFNKIKMMKAFKSWTWKPSQVFRFLGQYSFNLLFMKVS